ncbi:MAG: HDOD domain-containing protein [Caldimonas sp.]
MPSAVAPAVRSSSPMRAFGRYTLQRLLGKSAATMTWLAIDNASSAEAMLTMPRLPPTGQGVLADWLFSARRAARLDHPNLAPVAEYGVHEHWPFVAVDRGASRTLVEWLAQHPAPPIEDAAAWIAGVLRGLAYAHDAGISHLDLQLHSVLVDERGQALVMGLGAAPQASEGAAEPAARVESRTMPLEPTALRQQRVSAERDVLACGVVLHRLLAGVPVLGSDDVAQVIEAMAPIGREFVRLPWTTPHPIPEPLRAIANRSTAGQARLRYRGARTFLGALDGWRESAQDSGGPVALLLDRLRTVGHLPALPGLAARVQRVTTRESQRTDEIARYLLPDLALSFELLKTLNSAQVQGTQIAGNGPVLTLRRVVALIGVDGVRAAANSLRTWPGPLDTPGASALRSTIDTVRLAGHVAQALRPAGYDAEVVYLIAVLQNLGRLLLAYHFADEAEQIRLLMQPGTVSRTEGENSPAEQPGLSEALAAFAVLGVEVDALGQAAARQWGLGDDILHMARRAPSDAPVRKPDGDGDLLRLLGSAANETVEALGLPAAKISVALGRVVTRYAKVLRINTRVLSEAVQEARETLKEVGRVPSRSSESARTEVTAKAVATGSAPPGPA